MLDEDDFYMKIELDEIYNFLVLSFFIWDRWDGPKNYINFQLHNNHIQAFIILEN